MILEAMIIIITTIFMLTLARDLGSTLNWKAMRTTSTTTVVMTGSGDYGNPTCSGPGKTVLHDNHIYNPTGKVTECGKSLADWQAAGNDPGTTASTFPDDDVLVAMTRRLLNIPSK